MQLLRRIVGAFFLACFGVVALLAGLVALWRVEPPVSTLMLARYATGRPVIRDFAPLSRIAPALPAAVIMAEDGQFCRHRGVDWKALGEVLDTADDEDGPSRGASTLTMQVAKNLFLWPGRSVVRKGLELPLALLIDWAWPKRRILEVYLNIAEWGPDGLFGAQAAARRAFGKDAADLTPQNAALLAAVLPNPITRDPRRPSRGVSGYAATIGARLRSAGPWTDCLREPPTLSAR